MTDAPRCRYNMRALIHTLAESLTTAPKENER